MNTMVGCPIPGASQPRKSVRPVDANGILRSVDMSGCAYDGSEYQAYKAGVEYVRGLIEDAPTINPEKKRFFVALVILTHDWRKCNEKSKGFCEMGAALLEKEECGHYDKKESY